MNDERHMRTALDMSRRALGRVWPNPAVGCVIVRRDGDCDITVGRGATAPGGRPHAEPQALAEAGAAARGATAYVSLEPCAHHGRTGPCADALIAAGVARVVVAATDPDSRTNGAGIDRLRAAGIAVTSGVLEEGALRINAGFFTRVTKGRPLFTLKAASSLDGRIATATGQSQWITGDLARRRGHLLRAQHDAILVGANTARQDNPALTCRLPGLEDRSPLRIVVAGRTALDPGLAVFSDNAAPTWLVVGEGSDTAPFAGRNVTVLTVPVTDAGVDVTALARRLGEAGLTRVLVEGGSGMAAAFLQAGLVDRLAWFRSGSIIGGDGLAAIGGLGVQALESAARFKRVKVQDLGGDLLESYEILESETDL